MLEVVLNTMVGTVAERGWCEVTSVRGVLLSNVRTELGAGWFCETMRTPNSSVLSSTKGCLRLEKDVRGKVGFRAPRGLLEGTWDTLGGVRRGWEEGGDKPEEDDEEETEKPAIGDNGGVA